MTEVTQESVRRVRCAVCGHLIWRSLVDCSCTSVLEHKCKSCGALLLVRLGRAVEVLTQGTR